MKILTLIAPPGGGKGTQARKMEQAYGFKILSVSDRLKEAKKYDSELARQFDEAKAAGTLIDDDVIIEKIRQWLDEPQYQDGVILDGFPRTLGQAEGFDAMLVEKGLELSAAIELHFKPEDDELLKQRQRGRRLQDIAAGREPRKDDGNEETMNRRMSVYWNETAPIVPYYAKQGLALEVDGKLSPDDGFAQLRSKLAGIGINPLPADNAKTPDNSPRAGK